MGKTVRDIMTTNVISATLEENVFEVAIKMKDHDIGMIPVVDNQGKAIGIVTDRDILVRSVADKKPGSGGLEDVMTTSLITGTPDMQVSEAIKLMGDKQIRRLLIVDNDKLVGVIALADIATRDQFADEATQALKQISKPRK